MAAYNFQIGDTVTVSMGRGRVDGPYVGKIRATKPGDWQEYAVELNSPTPSGTWMVIVSGDKLERI